MNETMAYGTPVLTINACVAGMELIDNGKNGYIVHEDSSDEVIVAINNILNNTEM